MEEGQEKPGSVQGPISIHDSKDVFISMSYWNVESCVDWLSSQQECERDLGNTFLMAIGHNQC
jgi:hypothetical protein